MVNICVILNKVTSILRHIKIMIISLAPYVALKMFNLLALSTVHLIEGCHIFLIN